MFKKMGRISLLPLFLLLMGVSQVASATLVNLCINPRTPSAAAGMTFGPSIYLSFTSPPAGSLPAPQRWSYLTTYNSTTRYCQHAPNTQNVDVPINQNPFTAKYGAEVKVLLGNGKYLTQACSKQVNMVNPTSGFGGDPEVFLWINFDVVSTKVLDPNTATWIGPYKNIKNCVLARGPA